MPHCLSPFPSTEAAERLSFFAWDSIIYVFIKYSGFEPGHIWPKEKTSTTTKPQSFQQINNNRKIKNKNIRQSKNLSRN